MSTDPNWLHILKRKYENDIREKFDRKFTINILSVGWWKGKPIFKWFKGGFKGDSKT